MDLQIEALLDAFVVTNRRLAIFDRSVREALGLWDTQQSYPISEIINLFAHRDEFQVGDSKVVIPLHESDTAELTGEYLLYRTDLTVDCITYYDYSAGKPVPLKLPEFAATYPAFRLRYWHPSYQPPTVPSFLRELSDFGTEFDPESVETPSVTAQAAADETTLFDELEQFVLRERNAAREVAREIFRNVSPRQYHSKYVGIPKLEPLGREYDKEIGQVCTFGVLSDDGEPVTQVDIRDEYGIFPGTEVLVTTNESNGFPIEAEVLDIDGRVLSLGVYWTRSDDKSAAEDAVSDRSLPFRLGELLNPTTYDRQDAAIRTIHDDGRKWGAIVGDRTISFDQSISSGRKLGSLNQYQKHAALNSLRAEDVYCIHGPPGTGKTRTLIRLIEEAIDRELRVLACAHSNQAIDNLLVGASTLERSAASSLHHAAQEGEFVMARAGNNSTNEVVQKHYATEDLWAANLVGSTTSAAHRFRENEFDLAVVDEATQASIPSTLIPYSKAKSVVLAGDHKQLPPYRSSEADDDESFEVSLFEHLLTVYGPDVSTLLQRQYRMNEAIAAFPNRAFYDEKLTHGQRNRTWTISGRDPLVAVDVAGEEKRTPGGSYYNDEEVTEVCREVSRLLHSGTGDTNIGIITPYSGQVGKIVASLKDLGDPTITDRVKVSTVDAFQGSERPVIIVSFVRSNPQGFSGFLTFPTEGQRRLNVAMTRAQKRLVLIGNWDTLSTRAPNRSPEESCADVYADLFEHLRMNDCFRAPVTQDT